jgi:predicted  nucleic acid-binding Zn-ribbon protein
MGFFKVLQDMAEVLALTGEILESVKELEKHVGDIRERIAKLEERLDTLSDVGMLQMEEKEEPLIF